MKAAASILAACSVLAAGGVRAESLQDPTRPPATVDVSLSATNGEQAAPAGLQSIIRNSQGKPAAIINGEYVALGGQVGDAKLVKIGEDSVILQSAAGRETLKLIPGIEKTPAKKAADVKEGSKRFREKVKE